MTPPPTLLALGVVALCAVPLLVFGASRPIDITPDILVWSVRTWITVPPAGATEAQHAAATLALINDNPLPTGFVLFDFRGGSTGLLSSETTLSGNRLVSLTSMDDTADLGSLEITVGSVVVATATRANGMITDDDGMATAEILFEVGDSFPIEVQGRWLDTSGVQYRRDIFRVQ